MNNEKKSQGIESFKSKLKLSGVRITPQRMEIFREIADSDNHPDAVTVYRGVRKRIPAVSLDTVYRTLWLFNDLGLITTLGSHREKTRFDANLESHHHFICRKCGAMHDFYSDELDRIRIPETVKTFGSVEKAQVEVRGLCLRCLKEKEKLSNRTQLYKETIL
jgi:Fur family peroxide stress response transcriptional regulator